MLEQRVLLIRCWQQAGSPAEPRLWIQPVGQPRPVGFVRQAPRQGPRWLRWLLGPVLAVHEDDDEPLLLTLARGLRSWRVRDAEDHIVGWIRGRRVYNAREDFLAQFRPSTPSSPARYRAGETDLALVARESEGLRITFQMGENANPFVKMILLAAVLVHHQEELKQSREQSTSRGAFSAGG